MKKIATSLARIETLDLLRGYFLLVIILNHLHYYPSGLEWITGQSFLYASTAEGFFLISGIVLGIVRGAKLVEAPFKIASKLLLKRAFQLYLTSIILVLFFTVIGWLFLGNPGLKFGIWQPIGDFGALIWQTLTMQYTYGWADYLRLYAIFIFVSPLALWLLRKGLWYVLLLASLGVWALFPVDQLPDAFIWQPLSWQLVFFIGFILGFHWKDVTSWWHNLADRIKRIALATIIPVAVITLAVNVLVVFGNTLPGIGADLQTLNNLWSADFNKDRLPLLRILLFSTWFIALFWLFSKFSTRIKQWFGWLLLPFGTNSLYVYTLQAFVVFFVMLIFNEKPYPWYVNLAISLGSVGLVYLAVRTKFLMKIIPR